PSRARRPRPLRSRRLTAPRRSTRSSRASSWPTPERDVYLYEATHRRLPMTLPVIASERSESRDLHLTIAAPVVSRGARGQQPERPEAGNQLTNSPRLSRRDLWSLPVERLRRDEVDERTDRLEASEVRVRAPVAD